MDCSKKRSINFLLIGLSLLVWLGACLFMAWLSRRYDGALLSNSLGLAVYGPVFLLVSVFFQSSEPHDTPRKGNSRWAGAALFLLLTACAFLLAASGRSPLYEPILWWLAAVGLLFLVFWLYRRSPYRRPMRPRGARAPLLGVVLTISLLYLSFMLSFALFLAVHHPVTVEQIRPAGEAEGGEFIGRITGDHRETPLGVYFFADIDSRWYYYDVLTGEPVAYEAQNAPSVRP